MGGIVDLWRRSPAVRMTVRAMAVAVLTFFATSFAAGDVVDWKGLLYGAAAAAIYALLGILTPMEPKVGIKTQVLDGIAHL